MISGVPVGEWEIGAFFIGYTLEARRVTVPPGGSIEVNFQIRDTIIALEPLVVRGG